MQNDIPSLEDVKSHFDHWRATRPKRCKTPSFLWDKVKPIIGHYSLTSITQALRINSGQIKQHVQSDDGMQFVDISDSLTPFFANPATDNKPAPVDQDKALTVSIEMRRATGEVLNINALPMTSLREVVTQFIG